METHANHNGRFRGIVLPVSLSVLVSVGSVIFGDRLKMAESSSAVEVQLKFQKDEIERLRRVVEFLNQRVARLEARIEPRRVEPLR